MLGALRFFRSRANAVKKGGGEEEVRWVTIMQTTDLVAARIAVGHLEDAGIPVRIRQEGVHSVIPVNVGLLALMEVMVPEERAEAARQVLDEAGLLTDE